MTRTLSWYIWQIEKYLLWWERCRNCSEAEDGHHCQIWHMVVRKDEYCILWERKRRET